MANIPTPGAAVVWSQSLRAAAHLSGWALQRASDGTGGICATVTPQNAGYSDTNSFSASYCLGLLEAAFPFLDRETHLHHHHAGLC